MSYQRQIAWLTQKVNELLDEGCGCDCNDAVGGNLPLVRVSFGRNNNGIVGDTVFFTRTDTLLDVDTAYENPIEVDKLIIDIPDWESIQDYSPVLLIDRWNPRKKIGGVRGDVWRKSGYRHETEYHANFNGRDTEVPLTDQRTICDIKAEGYFKIKNGDPLIKGIGKKYKFTGIIDGITGPGVYTYIGLRLRLTIDGEVTESPIFAHLKMSLINVDVTGSGETYNALVRFSWA